VNEESLVGKLKRTREYWRFKDRGSILALSPNRTRDPKSFKMMIKLGRGEGIVHKNSIPGSERHTRSALSVDKTNEDMPIGTTGRIKVHWHR
jgi:hypothetical protein